MDGSAFPWPRTVPCTQAVVPSSIVRAGCSLFSDPLYLVCTTLYSPSLVLAHVLPRPVLPTGALGCQFVVLDVGVCAHIFLLTYQWCVVRSWQCLAALFKAGLGPRWSGSISCR